MPEERYIEAVGRRKTSVARVRIVPATKNTIEINGKDIEHHFPIAEHKMTAKAALGNIPHKFRVTAKVKGGGISSQAEALRHGITRAIVKYDAALRMELKQKGFLKRDPRAKERRKFGLKKARKAPQWSKR